MGLFDAYDVLCIDGNGELYVDLEKGGNLNKNERIYNDKKDISTSVKNLSVLQSKKQIFIIPDDLKKYHFKSGKMTKKPDEDYMISNWVVGGDSGKIISINEKFVRNDNDKPITEFAKLMINELAPFDFENRTEEDANFIRTVINHVQANTVTADEAIKLGDVLGWNIYIKFYSKPNRGSTEVGVKLND